MFALLAAAWVVLSAASTAGPTAFLIACYMAHRKVESSAVRHSLELVDPRVVSTAVRSAASMAAQTAALTAAR